MSTGSPRQLWLLPALLITVIATALGALIARDLYDEPAAPPPAVVAPSPSSAPAPSEQPGPADVKGTADAVVHPMYATIQPLLQTYFEAINNRDYDRWSGTVTAERRASQPRSKWEHDYRSTKDGSIVIHRIETGGNGLARVLLQFTSTQDLSSAPPELKVECIRWHVVWGFEKERGAWKLAAGSTSATPQHEACEGF